MFPTNRLWSAVAASPTPSPSSQAQFPLHTISHSIPIPYHLMLNSYSIPSHAQFPLHTISCLIPTPYHSHSLIPRLHSEAFFSHRIKNCDKSWLGWRPGKEATTHSFLTPYRQAASCLPSPTVIAWAVILFSHPLQTRVHTHYLDVCAHSQIVSQHFVSSSIMEETRWNSTCLEKEN